ncbi:BZ3500_MvSof-1268-A1-R1_Chr9g10378 [Microbotryum saponariae]|uniref:BZ3500_MvSof-1268-A1-R1_Chr9g10378 protein n=1 Tax=Microbotryum saponariae TaxID=289078 RepID=A0A2X0L679_9BASI|nr:BZ3501_MvSof-1269-A2-R1_Chr9g10128 [Microbotryum saponariae]SCZ99988.1 BZ3500_MvSof-1268-A1-R1_Chr9g10378 [Microbotryum saponariae]
MSKKGAAPSVDKSYTAGDIVLAKIKGYPSWPGQITDGKDAPVNVRSQQPPKSKTYLVRFFPTGDYAWTAPRDISSLTKDEIDTYVSSSSKKKGDLLEAYKIAKDPSSWLKAREDEANAVAAYDDEDMLASADEASGSKGKATTKKRKAVAAKKDPVEDKKAKKAKLEKLAKTRAPPKSTKKAEKEEAEAAPPSKKSKPTPAPAPVEVDDPGLKQVRDWRHKLQKVFLSNKNEVPLNADEMPKCREYFDAMETFVMKREWLAESKLAKVLKRIVLLNPNQIPDEETYKFRERSTALAQKWASLTDPSGQATPKEDGTAKPEEHKDLAAASTETPNDSSAPAEESKDKMEGVTETNGTNGSASTKAADASPANDAATTAPQDEVTA